MLMRCFRVVLMLLALMVLSFVPSCSIFNRESAPEIQVQALTANTFKLAFGEQDVSITLDAPEGGDLSGLNISRVEIDGGQVILVHDPTGHYLPEIRYFTEDTPTPLRIVLRLSEYSPQSIHAEHNMDIDGLTNNKKVGNGKLTDIKALLQPYLESGVSGLLIAAPQLMNGTGEVSVYESYLPGTFVVAPADMSELGNVDNILVISFIKFPDLSLEEIISAEVKPVNVISMVGLSLDDVANFQVMADNPGIDPKDLTPFGEKTVQEQFSEVQTRTIRKLINIVQIIDQPCGAADMDQKIFAMDPAPGTQVTPLTDKVVLYRCEEVSTQQIQIIDLSYTPQSDACSRSNTPVGVDVVEVIDTSGSMGGGGIEAAKAAAVDFTQRLDPESDQIGLVEFNSGASVLSEITNDYGQVAGLVSGLEAGGGTSIDSGLNTGFQVLQSSGRSGVPKVIILLSDGGSNAASALAAAGYIKSNGVNIITVGVGDADRSLLARIANTSQEFLFTESNEGLADKFDEAFQLSKRPVVAKDLTIRFTANTSQYDVMENLLTGTAQQPGYGVIEWKLPTVMEGQVFQQEVVVRPLTAADAPYGQLEISYDQCADGTMETLPPEAITQAETKEIKFTHEVIKKGTVRTGVLEEYQSQQFVVETGAIGLFSVEVEGAGSELPPEIVSGSGIDYLEPLYSARKDDKTVSLFFLKDPKLYWFYLQSNGPQDTGDFKLNILDGETADLVPLESDSAAVETSISPRQTLVYDIQGIDEGDYFTVSLQLQNNGYSPSLELVSLDGTWSYSLYDKQLGSEKTKRYVEVYQAHGKGPYRLIATPYDDEKDTQFTIQVEKGDQLGETVGEMTFGMEVDEAIPTDKALLWTFQGKEEQIINLHLRKDADDYLDYTIYGPEGEYVAGDYLSTDQTDSNSGPTQLDTDGVYTIAVVSEGSQTSPVNLLLEMVDLPPALSGSIENDKPITAPMVNNREDNWTFSGKAGDRTTIRVFTSNADAYVYFSLLGPDGNRILYASTNQGRGQLGPINLPQNGEYGISVYATSTQQGTYEITLNPAQESSLTTPVGPSQSTTTSSSGSSQPQASSSRILLYEDNGNLAPWIRETLDEMGLKYTQVNAGAIGDLADKVRSQTDWDLIIVAAEGKGSAIQGDTWEPIMTQVLDHQTALIAEVWNLDQIAYGRISRLLEACGVAFQRDLSQANPIFPLVSDHPVFNQPNADINLTNFSKTWQDQAGDQMKLTPNSAAVLLAGLKEDQKSSYGVSASCLDGRMIIQTFSDHDYHEEAIKALWENYIRYVLENRSQVSP